MEFLLNMAQFGLQALIILGVLLVLIAFIASLVSKEKQGSDLKVKNLNKKLSNSRQSLENSLLDKKALKKKRKESKKADKAKTDKPRLFVMDFKGDIHASATEQLREEVSSVLMVAQKTDQVLIRLESPGGVVHGYGLAASQLARFKDKGIPLTICVDKVAASGGYMMACLADKIIAAPFAIIGSIGVVASLPNFNKVLKKNDVDYLEITAGEFKRTLTPLGEVTDSGMKKFKEQIQQIHDLFKNHVHSQRPQLELSQVATGEYWYGSQALDLKLVDELGTSDDFILSHQDSHKILQVTHQAKKTLKDKLNEGLQFQFRSSLDSIQDWVWKQNLP